MPANERLRRYRIERNWRQQEVADELGMALITYQRWEQGKQQPSAYYRVKLCDLFGKSALELGLLEEFSPSDGAESQASDAEQAAATLPDEGSQQGLSSVKAESPWNVPFARNPFFTGRSQLLERLHEQLSRRKSIALTQAAALSGLGGIGKTQTAIEYAYRYRQDYSFIFWARADSRDTLMADYVAIAQLLALPGHDAKEQMQVLTTVKRWLQAQEDWLLILDNADELSLLPDFLPRESNGHLLLTTRAQATGKLARSIPVEKMEMSEGIRLLLRRATLLSEDEPLETVSAATRSAAQQLVEELDSLPLALDQAGSYIEETGCSLSQYLELYTQHRLALLKRKSSMGSDYPHTVTSTWTLSFSQVEQTDPAAADLLRACAFLQPDAIPEEILTEGAAALGPHLQQVASEPLLLNEAIQVLRRYSLVKRDAEAKLLHMHRLVQVVLKESLDASMQRQWAERAVLAINAAFPSVEHSVWSQCERLLSQSLIAAQLIEQYQLVSTEAGRLLHETATYLLERARYAEAEALYQQAVRIRELQLGPAHPLVAESVNELADLLRARGKFERAEPLHQRALQIREQQLGPEHPLVAYSLHTMAILYIQQGKYAEAEALNLRALRIREQQLGPEHPDVAVSLNNLAILYYYQGKYAEASSLWERTLQITEQHRGPEHPTLAYPLQNLAEFYQMQGKYEQAESFYQRALAIKEKAYGPDHPEIAMSLDGLADLYYESGKYEQAEPLFKRALQIREQHLGPEHHEVAYPLIGLANLYREQGKYEQAEPLYLRALRIREQSLGSEHSLVAHPLNDLAILYYQQGRYAEAETLYQRALRIREQQLGFKDALAADTLNNLARLYTTLGRYAEAEPLYHRALTIREQQSGAQHPKTTEIRTRLIELLHAMGRHEDAALLEEAQGEQRTHEEEQKAHLEE